MIRNAYIKFMCWLYYKFERILHLLGQDAAPKILYEGTLSRYELDLLCILADAGCDVVCLEYEGDSSYQKLDPQNKKTQPYLPKEQFPFPQGLSIEQMIRQKQRNDRISLVYDRDKTARPRTNSWMPENWDLFRESLKEPDERGQDTEEFCNLFVRIRGVWEKVSYIQDLFHWKTQLEAKKRNFFVIEDLLAPQNEEIRMVGAKNYTDLEQMILDLAPRLKATGQENLDQQVRMAFVSEILSDNPAWEQNIHKKKNAAVYLICWFNRYVNRIFAGYQRGKVGTAVYFGACKNQYEACFFRMLAWMPLDVVILSPDAHAACCLTDKRLLEKQYTDSLRLEHFPETAGACKAGTVAYHAEQELNEMLYQDTGMYRDRQYHKADTRTVKNDVRRGGSAVGSGTEIPAGIRHYTEQGDDAGSGGKNLRRKGQRSGRLLEADPQAMHCRDISDHTARLVPKGRFLYGRNAEDDCKRKSRQKESKGKPILCVCDLKGRGSGLYPGKNRGGNPAEANLRHI